MIFEELIEVRDETPHPAALNMAIDEALLRQAVAPLLRIYRWERPAASFGYFGNLPRSNERAPVWSGFVGGQAGALCLTAKT